MKAKPIKITIEDRNAAWKLGIQAFRDGKQCVPMQDMNNLAPLFEGKPFGYSSLVMDAWIKAWTVTNLNSK